MREPGPPGWGSPRWDSKVWLRVLRDSDHWVITLRKGAPQRQDRKFQTATFQQEVISVRKSHKDARYQNSRKVTSNFEMWVVGDNEKETQCLWVNWGTLFLGDINTGTWPSRSGVSKIGTIKYGLESRGTQPRQGLRWRGQAATANYRPVLSSERAS
jgi:hypothetical protein